MKSILRNGTIALAVVCAFGTVQAQVGSRSPELQVDVRGPDKLDAAPLRLTEDQRSAIADAVRRERRTVTVPMKFEVAVGAPVPPALELYTLPDGVLAELPAANAVKYTVVDNHLVLVDPTTMRVVDVIAK